MNFFASLSLSPNPQLIIACTQKAKLTALLPSSSSCNEQGGERAV